MVTGSYFHQLPKQRMVKTLTSITHFMEKVLTDTRLSISAKQRCTDVYVCKPIGPYCCFDSTGCLCDGGKTDWSHGD